MYNRDLREYRVRLVKCFRTKLFQGHFESANEIVKNVLIGLPALILTIVTSLLVVVWAVFVLLTMPIWIPIYISIKVIRRAYYTRYNLKFYKRCGSPFKMFENRIK